MPVNIEYIQFKGELLNTKNQPESNLNISIQFFNINLNSWVSLAEKLVVEDSKIYSSIKIPDRISTSNQTIRIVREIIKSGGVPSFRIIKTNKKSKLIEVIASDFKVHIQKKKETLIVDFGTYWLLPKKGIVNAKTHLIIATSLPISNFYSKISKIEQEKEELVKLHTEAKKTISSLNKNVKQLSDEKKAFNLASKNVKNQTQEKGILQSQNTKSKAKVSESETTNQQNFKEKYFSLQEKLVSIEKEKKNLSQEKNSFLASIAKFQKDVKKDKEIISNKNAELRSNQILINSLEQKTSKLEKELDEIKKFNKTDHPNKLSASKVYGSIVKDVIKADEELLNSKFKLANVSLNLKTTVEKSAEGTMLGLLDLETAKNVNSAAISDISIDIVPNSNAIVNNGQKMPNILGLTETAVRKILTEYSLKLDAVYHVTKDSNLVEGQSFKQSPAPDTNIIEGQEVIVIFAKPLNS